MIYVVRYMTFDAPGRTKTEKDGPWDYAANARKSRNALFTRDETITHCWIDKVRNGRVIERYGAILKRSDQLEVA